MTRGFGEVDLIAALPTSVVAFAALVTQLGDVWFVFLLLGVLYWFGDALTGPLSLDRRRAAFLVALALGARAVTTTLKHWFAYPRPAGAEEPAALEFLPALLQEAYAGAATAHGFGFPSGHAVAAAVVYGGLALQVDTNRAYAAAVVIVPLIALSRIVLGVHYAVDVLVGLAAGGAYLVAVWRGCDRGSNVGRALTAALLVALIGAAARYDFRTMASLGGVLGARIAWGVVGDAITREASTRTGGAVAAALGVGLGGLFAAMYELHVDPHVAFLGMALVLGGVVAAPLFAEAVARRLDGRRTVTAGAGE